MRKKALVVAAIIGVVTAAALVPAVLFTRLGIFALGHRFWMARAADANTPEETDAHLRRVLGATQYGVNQAETFVLELRNREDRIRLWNRLIALAPNEHWKRLYGYRLEAEYERNAPRRQKSP